MARTPTRTRTRRIRQVCKGIHAVDSGSREDPRWEGVGSPALQCPRGVVKLCCRAQGLKLCCDGTGKGVALEATENDDLSEEFIEKADLLAFSSVSGQALGGSVPFSFFWLVACLCKLGELHPCCGQWLQEGSLLGRGRPWRCSAQGGVVKLCSWAQGLKLCCDGTGKGVPLEATESHALSKEFIEKSGASEQDLGGSMMSRPSGKLTEVV